MNILMLDIDGVLNSASWVDHRRPSKGHYALVSLTEHERRAVRSLDPEAVQCVNRIVEVTGAAVVLSSSWRSDWPLPTLQRLLRWQGFTGHLLGATPDAEQLRDHGQNIRISRGEEITAWLALFPLSERPNYVVVDDDVIVGHDGHYYPIDFMQGLLASDVGPIIAMFQPEPDKEILDT